MLSLILYNIYHWGQKVFVNEIDNGWARLSLGDKHEQKYGFFTSKPSYKKIN